jgi:cell division protein ZapA
MEAKNKVTVTINSRKYTVVSDETPEYMRALADHVDQKVRRVLQNGQNILGERPLVLAALNICDEYFKVYEAGDLMQKQLQTCTDKLNAALDENQKLKAAKPNQVSPQKNDSKSEVGQLKQKVKALEEMLARQKKDFQAKEKEFLDMIDRNED